MDRITGAVLHSFRQWAWVYRTVGVAGQEVVAAKQKAEEVMAQGLATIEDFLMAEKPVGLDELLDCAEREQSSWDVGHMPPTTTLRYIILAMDFAASEPKRWRTYRARYAFPDLTLDELAVKLGVSRRTVINHLQPVRLAEVDEFFNRDLMSEAGINYE